MRNAVLVACLLTTATAAFAAGPTVVRPIPGYVCAKAVLTQQEVFDPRSGGIVIRTAPSESAPVATVAPSVLFVRQPMHVENGFAEVLQITNQPGWFPVRKMEPMPIWARCTPSLMSNGRVGAAP